MITRINNDPSGPDAPCRDERTNPSLHQKLASIGLPLEKEMIQHQIDNLVYTLYSLTDEEITIGKRSYVLPVYCEIL